MNSAVGDGPRKGHVAEIYEGAIPDSPVPSSEREDREGGEGAARDAKVDRIYRSVLLRRPQNEAADSFAAESLTAGSYQASFNRPVARQNKRTTERLLTPSHSILGFIFPVRCHPL